MFSLEAQAKDVGVPGGCINYTFISSFLSNALPSRHLPSYMYDTYCSGCIISWGFVFLLHSEEMNQLCSTPDTLLTLNFVPDTGEQKIFLLAIIAAFDKRAKDQHNEYQFFLLVIKCLDILEVFIAPFECSPTNKNVAIKWQMG